jgi:hypothetical protein
MNAEQWFTCEEPAAMLEHLGRGADPRKVRLFTCACCRRAWHLLSAGPVRIAVEVCERAADGAATTHELAEAVNEAMAVRDGKGPADLVVRGIAYHDLQRAALITASGVVGRVLQAAGLGPLDAGYSLLCAAEEGLSAGWVRCLFGNPFRPSPPLPAAVLAWNGGTLHRLAVALYETRHLPAGTLDCGLLAVLADALLDAGCEDEAMMAHCRSPEPHIRGCWVVDALLGR